MMYLTRLKLDRSRLALTWSANPYRVHQRLAMAFAGRDPRLLFRLEDTRAGTQILVQCQSKPDWDRAFSDLRVLAAPAECKPFGLHLEAGGHYRFRLLGNPCVKRNGKRLGLLRDEQQRAWLGRKFGEAGADLVTCRLLPQGHKTSRKNLQKEDGPQTHFAVLFEGILRARDPRRLVEAVGSGVGPAKGYGFGLLSLARVRG